MKKIAIMANSATVAGLGTQTVDDKYIEPVTQLCQALPIIVPTTASTAHIDNILDIVDGIILTGDESNIHPREYGVDGDASTHGPFDESRDRVAFQLIRGAIDQQIPLLGICRGMQEINVALGGSLQNNILTNPQFTSHQKNTEIDVDKRYGIAHKITINHGTKLHNAAGTSSASVNSLHEQAIETLAPSLTLSALSDDGLVEAVEHKTANALFGVQWHVEYNALHNTLSRSIFDLFTKSL